MTRIIGLVVFALLAIAPNVQAAVPLHASSLVVETLPRFSGVRVHYHGHLYLTDAQGLVVIPKARGVSRLLVLRDLHVSPPVPTADTSIRFARFFTAKARTIAAFTTYRSVRFEFENLEHQAVPTANVERLILRSSIGAQRGYKGNSLDLPHWLLAQRVVPLHGGPQLKNVVYSALRAEVLGSDVVNASQQHFEPKRTLLARFTLSFYPLTITTRDALFGGSAGRRALVQYPNGRVVTVSLAHGRATLPGLPRGEYQITVEGAAYSFRSPVSLSRSQIADIPVVTFLDVGVLGGTVLIVGVALLLLGRPHLARVHRRHVVVVEQEA